MSNLQTTAPLPITPGTVLAGKYRVERILGQGGMGIVVVARHIALDERVALKFLLPEYAQHPEASARFEREARSAVKIKSEHVARVSDVGTLETGAPYMVMEFLEGDDLSKILEKRGVLAIPEAIDYVIQACDAIGEAHSYGIVHRDIKPANLFLTRRPDGFPLVKVLDFGISKTMGAVENLTKTMAAMGSALYMSPEQMQQTRSVDHRTDIYALGISLYELLAGKQPYYAETLPQLCAEILTGTPTPIRIARPDVSDALAAAVEKAYARDRGLRYGSIAEFVVGIAPWAPAASRGTIERIARMGGIAPPTFDGRPPMPSAPQQQPHQGQGQPLGPRPTSPSSGQILLGPYQGPASARASAAFATQASSTNTSLSTTGAGRAGSSKAPLVASLVFGALAVIAIGAVFLMRREPDAKPAASADATASAEASTAPTATANPSATASATASAAAPEASTTASATATANTAEAVDSAAPTAAPAQGRPGQHNTRPPPRTPPRSETRPAPAQQAAPPAGDPLAVPGTRYN